ncbi:hypothetical protein ACTA71_006337 [Dictyostelium dimigraforme]
MAWENVIVDSNLCYQAASIPYVYLTLLPSIFNVGSFSIKGGVGLSALNLLKWKGHKISCICDCGFKIERTIPFRYIYVGNQNFAREIKLKLKELGSNKKDVDLMINTLSSDNMDSNFKYLNTSGRISLKKITIGIESGELIPIAAYSNLDIQVNLGLELLIKKNKLINFHFKGIDISDSNQSTTTTTTTTTLIQ